MPTPPSDEILMLQYRDGDVNAFTELYRRHSAGLYRFLSWRAPRRDWVDEIAQDSWIALHQARARYQPSASFKTYLYQIARNRLIDLQRQPRALLASELEREHGGQPLFERLAEAAQELPDDHGAAPLETRQAQAALHAAIQALPAEQKEALVLQQFSDMSLEDIAMLVEVPVETVKSRLRYAMRKLREQLAPQTAGQRMAEAQTAGQGEQA